MSARQLALAAALALGGLACGRIEDPSLLPGPRSPLPAALAGSWFTGTLSTLQYYDRVTGQFQDPSGSGFYYVLGADGSYETGAVMDSTVAGCTMRLLGREIGTLTLEGQTLLRHRAWIRTQVNNTCGRADVAEHGPAQLPMSFSLETDADGREWLVLTDPDFGTTRYHRW